MLILLTGGSACGKSTYAERLVCRFPLPRVYIATMKPYGEESLKKIDRHRRMRAEKGFRTAELYTDVEKADIPAGATVLLECMCNLTANEMFDDDGEVFDVYDKILDSVDALSHKCKNLVIVTNDTGSDGCEYDSSTRLYIETLGALNAALAGRADHVYELVCGIPIVLKGELI